MKFFNQINIFRNIIYFLCLIIVIIYIGYCDIYVFNTLVSQENNMGNIFYYIVLYIGILYLLPINIIPFFKDKIGIQKESLLVLIQKLYNIILFSPSALLLILANSIKKLLESKTTIILKTSWLTFKRRYTEDDLNSLLNGFSFQRENFPISEENNDILFNLIKNNEFPFENQVSIAKAFYNDRVLEMQPGIFENIWNSLYYFYSSNPKTAIAITTVIIGLISAYFATSSSTISSMINHYRTQNEHIVQAENRALDNIENLGDNQGCINNSFHQGLENLTSMSKIDDLSIKKLEVRATQAELDIIEAENTTLLTWLLPHINTSAPITVTVLAFLSYLVNNQAARVTRFRDYWNSLTEEARVNVLDSLDIEDMKNRELTFIHAFIKAINILFNNSPIFTMETRQTLVSSIARITIMNVFEQEVEVNRPTDDQPEEKSFYPRRPDDDDDNDGSSSHHTPKPVRRVPGAGKNVFGF